jgi:hypothetical protein
MTNPEEHGAEYQVHQSFRSLSTPAEIQKRIREERIQKELLTNIRLIQGQRLSVHEYGTREARRDLPLQEAAHQVEVEAAALFHQFPQLLVNTPGFPPLYRLLRYLELSGDMTRGGSSLFVGSGRTLTEFLGMYVQPPTEAMIADFFARPREFSKRYEQLQTARANFGTVPTPPLLDGSADAIEPHGELFSDLDRAQPFFGIQTDHVRRIPTTVGAALNSGTLTTYDTILLQRVDPEIFNSDSQKSPKALTRRERREQERRLQRQPGKNVDMSFGFVLNTSLMDRIITHLSPRGSMVVTIGTGLVDRDHAELYQRTALIQQLNAALPKLGLKHGESLPQQELF